jgi:hypothetical protein
MINSHVDSNPENSFVINEVKNLEYKLMMKLAYHLPTTTYLLLLTYLPQLRRIHSLIHQIPDLTCYQFFVFFVSDTKPSLAAI